MGLMSFNAWAGDCSQVYTIGAYDEAFENHAVVSKLGAIPASEVPPAIPPSFLENDGSYGGGEATCSIAEACQLLKTQLASGLLDSKENWHIYLLEAVWGKDTYLLHPNDYRLKHPVKVVALVKKDC
ncbi:hypothetical protein Lrub_0365 [Legionella rubrilucens]|uniref:Uncharacterized protein n=1 Tax=Legionella rubrilucens TaxID=458 RepID=A0A0W0Y054_9GAMM|nr:DVU_2496 family lipoprotein [Legionella rubrilucens]KTD49923.1 hypothetical protein Lrub_0365 [Legionella rubrilucens]